MSWIVPSPLSLRQAPDMSVVVLVLDDVLVVVLVELVLVVVGSAHDGAAVQLHWPDLQKKMMPFRQSRFAFFLNPAQRALMAGLHFLRLHGFFFAFTGDAETPRPRTSARTSPNARATGLPY